MSHKAIVAVVTQVTQILKADKIQLATVLGENVIVGKDVCVGYIGVLFPEGLQLSEEYCRENNLHRHAYLNKDNEKTGFFDDNRKVRAQPFLGVKSTAYFADLKSLQYIPGIEALKLKLGDSFDELEGHKLCQKYISKATQDKISRLNRPKQAKAAYAPFFAKHVDTEQFKHNAQLIPKGALIHFHSKKHGTSHRQGITKVVTSLPLWKRLINRFTNCFTTWKFEHVVGTRNVVLMDNNKEGFHGSESFRFDVAEQIKPHLKEGMCAYAEIVGYANGKPIMPQHSIKSLKNKDYTKKYGDNITYTYGCAEHEYRFHIYRLTYLTASDENIDFTQKQLEQWCDERLLPRTLEVAPPEIYDGDLERLCAKVEALVERPEVLTEDFTDTRHISEGIVLRIDTGRPTPYFLKQKSFAFKACEGLCEVEDTEEAA